MVGDVLIQTIGPNTLVTKINYFKYHIPDIFCHKLKNELNLKIWFYDGAASCRDQLD